MQSQQKIKIFMKFDIGNIFKKSLEKIHALLKCDKNDLNFYTSPYVQLLKYLPEFFLE